MNDHDDAPDDEGPDDEELAEMADDLSDVLRDLRDELRASREDRGMEPVEQPTSSSGGGVADFSIDLPSATDVLAFTDEKLIPAAITVLEVNIKALELLQKGIRWARPDRAGENARAVQSHAESVSRSTLQRLDTVLADLQDAASEGSLPENAEASGIITEARGLRDEIDAALAARAEARGEDGEPDGLPGGDVDDPADAADVNDEEAGRPGPWGDQPDVDVDVEGELQSIKAELGKEDEDGTSIDDVVSEEDDGDQTGDDGDAEQDDTDQDDTDQADGEQDADHTDSQTVEGSDDPPAGDDSSSDTDDDGSTTDGTDEASGEDADEDEPSENGTAASDSEESVDDS